MSYSLKALEDPTAAQVIAAGRNVYRSILNGAPLSIEALLSYTALALGLEGEDYEDLVRHLVTADEVDEDAFRWVTSSDRAAGTEGMK